MKKIFISGAYSAPTRDQVEDNIAHARAAAIELTRQGWAVFCPHLNTAHFEELLPELTGGDWLARCRVNRLEQDGKPPSNGQEDTGRLMGRVLDRDAHSVDGLSGVLHAGCGERPLVYYPFSQQFSNRGRFVSLVLGHAGQVA